jgi:hypothetical protein
MDVDGFSVEVEMEVLRELSREPIVNLLLNVKLVGARFGECW